MLLKIGRRRKEVEEWGWVGRTAYMIGPANSTASMLELEILLFYYAYI